MDMVVTVYIFQCILTIDDLFGLQMVCNEACVDASDNISPVYSLWATFIGLYVANYVVERSTGYVFPSMSLLRSIWCSVLIFINMGIECWIGGWVYLGCCNQFGLLYLFTLLYKGYFFRNTGKYRNNLIELVSLSGTHCQALPQTLPTSVF